MRITRKQGKTKTICCFFPYGINCHIFRWWAAPVSITSKPHRIFRFDETILRWARIPRVYVNLASGSHSSPFFPPLGGWNSCRPQEGQKRDENIPMTASCTMGTHIPFIFRRYDPYIGGLKPLFFMGFGVHGTIVYLPTMCFFGLMYSWVVATQIFFWLFIPNPGEDDSHFDTHIFPLGWFNHQLV